MNVGEVAELAGVTVRTLHHYDRIGLLTPSERTAAGYRRYTPSDLDRLHRVLVYRELGFPLEEVATLLDDPDADPAAHPGHGRGRREGDGGTADGDLPDPRGTVRAVRRRVLRGVPGRGRGAVGRH